MEKTSWGKREMEAPFDGSQGHTWMEKADIK
jgi:hypothetical protein